MGDETVTITRDQLVTAVKQWEADAAAGEWSPRIDDERFVDSADYLFDLLKG